MGGEIERCDLGKYIDDVLAPVFESARLSLPVFVVVALARGLRPRLVCLSRLAVGAIVDTGGSQLDVLRPIIRLFRGGEDSAEITGLWLELGIVVPSREVPSNSILLSSIADLVAPISFSVLESRSFVTRKL